MSSLLGPPPPPSMPTFAAPSPSPPTLDAAYASASTPMVITSPPRRPPPTPLIRYSSARSPMLHPALSSSLSRSFGLNSPFSLSALSSSLTAMSSSPGFSGMAMSLGRSFEERPKLEAQFFRNFQCCGLDLQDLHGLLEHFEECHVMFDEDGSAAGMDVGMDMGGDESDGTISGPPSPRLGATGNGPRSAFEAKKSALSSHFETPDSPAGHAAHLDAGMELDMDMDEPDDLAGSPSGSAHSSSGVPSSSAVTPNATFAAAPMSAFDSPLPLASGSSKKKYTSAMNSLGSNSMRLGMGVGGLMGGLEALNASRSSSGYQTPDSSIPGSPVMEEAPGAGVDGIFSVPSSASTQPGATVALAPSLLFPATPAESPESDHAPLAAVREPSVSSITAPPTAPEPEPEPEEEEEEEEHDLDLDAAILADGDRQTALTKALGVSSLSALPSALHPLGTGIQISPSGRPYTPPSEKPFKCSVPGCDKSYKQQNGLKYHRLHGHCNSNASGPDGDSKGEGKPYVCHVASCGKRYKNMNGLRYHYQHSGAHGALGLQMLAQGCHPPPQFPPGHKRAGQAMSSPLSRTSSPSRPTSRQASPSGLGLLARNLA